MPWKVPITVDGLTYPVEFGGDSEPSESDINAAVQQILAQSEQPPKEVPGYLSQLGTALSIGGRQMTAGVKGTFNALTGDDADTAEAMARMGALQREQEQAQTPQDIALTREFAKSKAAYDKAQGVWDTAEALSGYFGDVAEYPGAAFKQAVQSAPNAVIGTGTSIAGYALGGLLGAGAGAETGPGAILTGIAGAAAGGAVSNSLMEAGPAIYDVLNERTNGAAANMTAEQIAEVLRKDPTITSEGLKTGAIRGTVIGLVESLGMKGAGSILTIPERAAARAAQKTLMDAGVDVASKEAVEAAMKNVALRKSVSDAASTAKSQFTSAGNLARGAAATTIETASAGAGEVAAQVAAGQEIDPTAAVQEMIGEVGINAALTPAVKAAELAKRKPVTPAPDTDFARRAAMEGATEFRDTTAGSPVVVEGITIATIPPGSSLSPDDVAAFAGMPDGPAILKRYADQGRIVLPEIVKPVENVDKTLTDEMSQNIAAGAANARATVEELKKQEAQRLAEEGQTALPIEDVAGVIYDLRSAETGTALDLDELEMALDNVERRLQKGKPIDWPTDRIWLPNISTASVPALMKLLGSGEGIAAMRRRIEELRQQEAERAAAEEQEAQRLAEEEQTVAREAEERQKRYEAMRAEQSVKLELTPDESGATGAGMKEEIQQTPISREIAEEDRAEFEELQDLMTRRGQAQNKVRNVQFSKKDEARFQELGAKLKRYLFETVDPANDPVVGEDINDQPIQQSEQGTFYTVENGRVRTGPAFKPDPEYSRQQDEIIRQEKAAKAPAPQPITLTGEPQSIPLDQLTVIPEDMARAEVSRDANDERWQRASQSKEPVRAIRRPDGTLRIMDGHHRYLAARDRGDASIPVTIEPPFTPAQGKPTDSLPADQPTSGDVGTGAAVQRDPSKPEQMTPEERFNRSPAGVVRPKSLPLGTSKKSTRSRLLAQFDRGAAWADKNDSEKAELSSFQKRNDLFKTRQRNGHFGTDKAAEDYAFWRGAAAFFEAKQANSERRAERSLSGTQKVAQHSDDILIALDSNDPVSAEAVDTYGIKLPEGYVRQGELYVFQPTSGDVGKPMASDYTFSKSFSNDPAYLAGQRSKWRELFGKPAETVTLTDVDRVAAKKKWSKQTKDIYIQERKPLVESALREGKPVPAEVLADYPDLKPPAPRSPAPTPSTAETRGAEDEPFGKLPTEEVETELSRRTKQAEEEEAREKIEAPKRRAEAIQTFVSEGAVVQTRKRVVGRAKAREGGGDVTRTEHFLVHPDRREIPLSASEAKKVSTAAPRSPAANLVSFTAANGQKLVGEVQSVTGNKATVAYQWNGKTKTQVVPVSQLGSPVASVATPPKYQYNQEQNTRKLGKHFPTTLGVHANHDFRKSFASMAKDTALGQDYQMIAKLLSNMPEFKNMDLHLVADENIDYAGEYSWNRGKPSIAINLRLIARGQVDALGSILHEALHHITLAKVRNPQGAFENEVVSKLDLIRESVREYAESKGFGERLDYELGSTEEFITALFTRPDFQALIASIPDSAAPAVAVGKFRSLLSEIFRLIAELVHGKPVLRGSALEQAMTTSLALFNTPFRAIETGGLEALNAARSPGKGIKALFPQTGDKAAKPPELGERWWATTTRAEARSVLEPAALEELKAIAVRMDTNPNQPKAKLIDRLVQITGVYADAVGIRGADAVGPRGAMPDYTGQAEAAQQLMREQRAARAQQPKERGLPKKAKPRTPEEFARDMAALMARPATGGKPINLSAAYQKAATGKSSQWVTIKEVYEQAKAADPALTPEAFMQFVQQQNDAGGVMISPVENVSTVEAAQPFVIGNAGVEMIVPESSSPIYAAPIDTQPRTGDSDAEAGGSEMSAPISSELDARRKEAISAAVAQNDWGNYTREQKVAAAESFLAERVRGLGIFSPPHELLSRVTAGDPGGSYVRVDSADSKSLGVTINVGQGAGIDKYANFSPQEVFAHLYDIAQEEGIHVLQYMGLHRKWVESGAKGGTAGFLRLIEKEFKTTFDQINKARIDLQQTDPAAAQKIKDAMLASWNLYHAQDPVAGISGLWDRLGQSAEMQANFTLEMVRMLTQLKRQDFTTETGWQKFRSMIKRWLTDAINALRGVQDVFRSGMAGDLIQRQLADLEAALDGKPLPPVSRPAASRADDGEGVIDIGGEAEPADGGGTQLFKKRETAIGTTFITPADITLQERRSQEETLAKARKIIAEEVQKDEKGGRAVALQRFRSDMSIPPEVRTAGSGLIAQQADLLANLERDAIQQEGLDALADEAGKVSGIIGSDLEYWRNLQLAANLDIDKMAMEAGRTLNIFNVFRRLTPEGFLRRMKRQYNATVQESISQNFDIPPGEVEAEIMRLWRMMREAGATARGEAIAAALKSFMPRRVNTRRIIESLFPQAGTRQRMSKGGEALVRNFFQMMAGPRDQKGPLAEFDESIQNALSGMLRKVMEANGLVAKNQSKQATDIDKLVRSVSADELRFDKIAAADEAMQKELDAIEDPERRSTLRQAWEEATAKMYTNIASDATVRRAINSELKGMNVDWRKMFDSNQKPDAVKAKVVDAVMTKIEGLLTDAADPTVRQNLNMLRGEVEAAFDFIAANKRTEWLAYREGIEARRRVAEHRAAFMEALRNQGVAEDALLRISKKLLAGPLPQKPDQNPVSALVGEHMKEKVPNFVDKLVALDVDRATAEQLDTAAKALRADIAEVEKLKAAERAVKKLMDSLKPKPRAPREKIEKALKALFTAAETGALDSQEFFGALGEALGHPPLTAEQQAKIKKLTREINSLPKGAARVDKQQELDEELALWKGIAARDVLLSAWYANILSGISTQGMGLQGNSLNMALRSFFLAITNPRSAKAYFQGVFGEGLETGLREAKAAMKGRGLYKVSKYGDKNLIGMLELLRKKGPATLPEWIAYIASGGTRLRYVFRIMQAIDALAWNTAREGHAYLAAHRALLDQQRAGAKRSPEEFYRAFVESLGGDAKQIEEDMRTAREELISRGQTPDLTTIARMAGEARNARRSSTVNKMSNRFADRIVMQQDPEGSGRVIHHLINVIQREVEALGVPFGQLLVPFNKIVSSLFEQSLDYTPVGALRSYLGGHLTDVQSIDWSGKVQFKDKSVQFDAVERAERMAASVTGTLAASVMFALASLFKDEPDEDVPFMLYGLGPESKIKRDQMPKGWTPYSMKWGDTYIKFSEMPFGVMFAAAGNALDAMRYKNMDNKSSAQRLAYVLKTSAKGFTEQGVLSSFDTALEVLTFQASDKKFTDVPVNIAKGMVPGQGMLRDISVLFDPVKIKDDTIAAAFLRDFPVVRRIGTRPALNVFGEPMTFDGRIPFVRRIGTLREKHPVADYLGRNGLSIPGMAQTIVVGQYLPKDMKDRIQRRALQTSAMENGVFTVEQDYNFRKRAGELTKAAVEGLLTQVPTITSDRQRENVQNLINRKVEIARRRAMLEAVPAQ
jgi:hypothetical protein